MYLPKKIFLQVVKKVPLAAIDLILLDQRGRILLGKRRNNPAKGKWFVPGGRIQKNETFEKAIQRICREEVPSMRLGRPRFFGAFEHFYRVNMSGNGFGTHYVVLAYRLKIFPSQSLLVTRQHDCFRFFRPKEVLRTGAVHPNTKAYARQIVDI